MNRKFTKFQEHVNNAMETVQGEHLNKIQNAINGVEIDITEVYNRNFIDDCLFVLENNPYINMMFYLDFTTQDDIFRAKSKGYIHDIKNHCVMAQDNPGIVHSIAYKSDYGNVINDFIIKADADIPVGCAIKYYVSVDMKNYYPINPGMSTPLDLGTIGEQVYLKMELFKSVKGDTPKLYSVALYYKDQILDQNNSIKAPILTPIPSDGPKNVGDTIIIYDPATGRVKKVLEPDGSSTELVYDDSPEGKGRLDKTINTQSITVTEDRLIYGTYTDANGAVKEVLKAIRTVDVSNNTSGGGTP